MNKTIKSYLTFAFVGLLLGSCAESNLVVDEVFDGVTNGAVLRTISSSTPVLNSSEPSSSFTVEIEEQDTQDGALLESVDVKFSFSDQTPENGTTVISSAQIRNIAASEFSTDTPHGLPRTTITVTYGDMAAAGPITADDILPGDRLVIELWLNLSDGRVFGPPSAGGIITGGFFSSPFQYATFITCSPAGGDYTVDMHDSYGDGWQTTDSGAGEGLTCTLDGVVYAVAMCSLWGTFDFPCVAGDYYNATQILTLPDGGENAEWVFTGDYYGEISFEIYGPSGNLLYESGAAGAAPVGSLLPVVECAQ